MGKQGPCYHCGVTSTPLWRNGPAEKPVLCNACGSRWRTKGTLANYTPLHARVEPVEYEDSKMKTISIKNNEARMLKRKFVSDAVEHGFVYSDYSQRFHKGFDEDTSNRSSSGSAISNPENYAQYGSADASDLTGPYQPTVWDSTVPSRKRTCVARPKPSPVEKLTRDLYTIWHEQQSSCLSGSSEEDLLLESDKPMVSVEIGHGSVLIRHPSSIAREEESEASSLSVDKKQHTANSQHTTFGGFIEDTDGSSNKGIEKTKKPANRGPEHEQITRDKDQLEKLHILAHHDSPLCYIDLRDIVSFEKFSSHLTNEEQQQLLNLLPCADTSEAPYSLKTMFDSSQFDKNLLSFQKLLADGVFDNSFCGVSTEDYRSLKTLILSDLTESKWAEQYTLLKDLKRKNSIDSETLGGFNALETVHSEITTKRSRDGQHQKFAGSKNIQKRPRIIMKSSYDENDGSFLSPKSLFSLQDDAGSLMLDSDQDLLLDVPSNSSFPQAELLPTSSFGARACMSSSSSVYPNVILP